MTNDLALIDDGPLINTDALPESLGWALKDEGLCRDDRCVLVPDRDALTSGDMIDVTAVAALLDRPALVDETSGLVAVGAERGQRRAGINQLQAPDFSLPNAAGELTSLSEYRGRKRLLVAFATW